MKRKNDVKLRRYPMHEKLAAVKSQSQTCGEFLDWLNSKGYCIAAYQHGNERLSPVRLRAEELLAGFFRINLNKLDTEKRQMLAAIRGEAS